MSWPLSLGYGYAFHTVHTYRQTILASIQDVNVNIWLNTVNSTWNRSWLLPIVHSGESTGPFAVVLRLDDPDMNAMQYKINSAQLKKEDGTKLQLNLATEHPRTNDDSWHPFFKNASAWIGHLYHDSNVTLKGTVIVELDMTIEKNEDQHQETLEIRMDPTVKHRRGLFFR